MAVFSRIAIAASVLSFCSQAQAAAIQRRDSAGCGKTHDFVGDTRQFSIQSGGRERVYHINLPSNYDPNTAKPLLIAFHGRGQEATEFQQLSQLSNPSVNPDMISVFPSGVNKVWQGPSYADPNVNDLQFTTDLVNHLKSDYCIDTARIYAAGYSNGGGFTNTIACDANAGVPFAAFAAVSGAFYTDDHGNEGCSPNRSPLPMFESHGTGDQTVFYDGGEGAGGELPAIPNWLSRWSDRNKCDPVKMDDLPNGVTSETHTCQGQEDALHHYKLDGHSHAFPGEGDNQIFISPKIVEFLSPKTHPSPP